MVASSLSKGVGTLMDSFPSRVAFDLEHIPRLVRRTIMVYALKALECCFQAVGEASGMKYSIVADKLVVSARSSKKRHSRSHDGLALQLHRNAHAASAFLFGYCDVSCRNPTSAPSSADARDKWHQSVAFRASTTV